MGGSIPAERARPERFAACDRVFQDGSQLSPLSGVQTVNVPVGGGSIFELRLRQAGDYPFVTHAFADASKGGVGVLRALAPGEKPKEEKEEASGGR